MEFSIERSGNTATVLIKDAFLGENAKGLLAAIEELGIIDLLIMDFSQSNYINSSGISALIEIYKQTRARKYMVRLTGLSREIRDFFFHARLDEFFAIEDELEGLGIEQYVELLQDDEKRDLAIDKLVEMDDAAVLPMRNAIHSENELIRSGAITVLGKLDDSYMASRFSDILLHDESSFVRQAAAYALGFLLDEQTVPALISALEDNSSEVAEAAAASLSIFGSDEVREQLTGKLFHENPRVRGVAAQALGMISDKRVHKSLESLVADADPWVRVCAVQALGWMRSHPSVTVLIEALGDNDMRVREAAASSLGRIKSPDSIEPLGKSLFDENMWVAYFAAKALGQIGDKHAIAPLMHAYKTTSHENIKIAVLYALRELTAVEASEVYLDAFRSRNEDLRKEALMCLGKVFHQDLPAILRKALKDINWTVRYAALEIITLHQLRDMEEDLKLCLANESEDIVRNQIAKALTHLARRSQP